MPVNGLSVGKDISVTFEGPTGPITFNRIKNYNVKPKTSDKETTALDGQNRHAIIPMGYEGTMEFERVDNSIGLWWAQYETAYYAGQNLPAGTITETITEASGAITQYKYTGVTMKIVDLGDWKAEEYITIKVDFMASQRKQLS